MNNFETGNIIQTKNVRWTNQKYVDYKLKEEWNSESSNEEQDTIKKEDEEKRNEKLDEAASKRLESALKNCTIFIILQRLVHLGLMRTIVLSEEQMRNI